MNRIEVCFEERCIIIDGVRHPASISIEAEFFGKPIVLTFDDKGRLLVNGESKSEWRTSVEHITTFSTMEHPVLHGSFEHTPMFGTTYVKINGVCQYSYVNPLETETRISVDTLQSTR